MRVLLVFFLVLLVVPVWSVSSAARWESQCPNKNVPERIARRSLELHLKREVAHKPGWKD